MSGTPESKRTFSNGRFLLREFSESEPLHARNLKNSYQRESAPLTGATAGLFAAVASSTWLLNILSSSKTKKVTGPPSLVPPTIVVCVFVMGSFGGLYLGNEVAKEWYPISGGQDAVLEARAKYHEWLEKNA